MRCPHCRHIGTFSGVSSGIRWYKHKKIEDSESEGFVAGIRVCPNGECRGLVFAITTNSWVKPTLVKSFPPEVIDYDNTDIPERLKTTLEEAILCHSVGAYRAAAMMVRRLLEELCEDCDATGKTLHDRLETLKNKISMPHELFEAMGELKALGNDAAHITAKNYLDIGENESEDSIGLAKEILKSRYQLQTLVNRLRSRKKA
ncbi:protein of unknown function [Tritonibacter mobilis]|nr:protein of unknown function [Tritonibacter mobilis]